MDNLSLKRVSAQISIKVCSHFRWLHQEVENDLWYDVESIATEVCGTYASEHQLRVWNFCVSLSDLSELRRALNFPSRAGNL